MATQEHMLAIEVKGELQKLALCCRVLLQIRTDELPKQFSYSDAIGPILDPTGWMRIHDNARKNENVVRALKTFQAVLKKEWPELEAVDSG